MAGLFFCLASAEGAGLLFCPAAIQTHTSVYRAFCSVNATIPHTSQNVAQGFTGAFPTIDPFNRQRYQTDKSGYNAICATLEHITAPGRSAPIPDTTVTPGRCTGQHSRIPCKPGGVSMLPTPGGLQSGTGQRSGRTGWHPPPGGAVQRHGARRSARNHWRLSPLLFSGFRPIANRGQQ